MVLFITMWLGGTKLSKLIKKNLSKLYLIGDLLAFTLAGSLILFLEFYFSNNIYYRWYISTFFLISLSSIFLMYSYKLYKPDFKSYLPQVPVISKALFYSLLLFFLFTFFIRIFSYSRLAILSFAILAFLNLVFFRRIAYKFIRRLYLKGIGTTKLLIVGWDKSIKEVVDYLSEHPEYGYYLCGVFLDNCQEIDTGNLKILGDVERFLDITSHLNVESILVSLDDKEKIGQIVGYCEENGIEVLLVPDIIDFMAAPVQMNSISSIPLISFKKSPIRGDQGKIKRFFDVIFSLFGLIILSPLFLLVALLIILDNPGPIFFCHTRLGVNGKKIKVWKFRTMVVNAESILNELLEKDSALKREFLKEFKLKDDPRVTKLGNFLRKSSIDEIPQLFNVLKGEMSLVGPRPIVEKELENYQPYGHFILQVPPGITGLWQASGRNDTSYEERVKMDLFLYKELVILA